MSPHINSLVGDLVAMAQAMEKVPQLEQELQQVKLQLDNAQSHNQGLEQNISNYKQTIEDLNNKVRSLEVERDDASFRVLEAEDREHVATAMARSIASAVGNLVTTLDPPKPQPEPEKPIEGSNIHGIGPDTADGLNPSYIEQGPSESSPTGERQAGSQEGTKVEEAPKSDANPTGQVPQTQETQTTSGSTTEQGSVSEPLSGPYFNKRYHDEPHYIPLSAWLEGGGTEADYHWRPAFEKNFIGT